MIEIKELPTSIGDFKIIRKNNYLYVDKTEILYSLIARTGGKFFLRRPRRFGKSLTVSTLASLLQGNKELFQGLWIYDKWDWTPHSVVQLDFSKVDNFLDATSLSQRLNLLIVMAGKANNVILTSPDWNENFEILMFTLRERGNVAVLIDEYDSPFHNVALKSDTLNEVVKDGLGAFYKRLKGNENNYDFLFVTGITKIAKTSVFSGMNTLEDISLEPQFAALCGITQAELESVFSEHINHMANETNCSRTVLLDDLKSMYNGYTFSPKSIIRVYNPFSLNLALKHQTLRKFWFQSGTPTLLINLIKKSDYNLTFLNDLNMTDDEMSSSYEFSSMSLKNLLYDTGYLTIQQNSSEQETLRSRHASSFPLTFPNEEVRTAFANSILESLRGKPTSEIEVKLGEKLVEAMREGQWKDFAEIWN